MTINNGQQQQEEEEELVVVPPSSSSIPNNKRMKKIKEKISTKRQKSLSKNLSDMSEQEYEEATELTPQEERMRHSESSKSLGRGHASKESRNALYKIQNMQRTRRKEKQMIRAATRKPKKIERRNISKTNKNNTTISGGRYIRPTAEVKHKQTIDSFALKRTILQNRDYLKLSNDEQESISKDEWLKKIPEKLNELQKEETTYLSKFFKWQQLQSDIITSEGRCINLSPDTIHSNSSDLRKFFKPTKDGYTKQLYKEADKRYYAFVLEDPAPEFMALRSAQTGLNLNKPTTKGLNIMNICKKQGCGGSVLMESSTHNYICSMCGLMQDTIVDFCLDTNVNFSDREKYSKTTMPYEPLAHFKEHMSRLQGIERTEIPDIIIDAIKQRCFIHRINPLKNPELLTYTRCRQFLQDEGFPGAFENICQIITRVTGGHRPVTFTQEQINILTMMFLQIQGPYEKIKLRVKRKNMLSYAYTTYKCAELLGYTFALPYLPLFRSQMNLQKADDIWKEICNELKWQFVPTR